MGEEPIFRDLKIQGEIFNQVHDFSGVKAKSQPVKQFEP